MSTATLFLATGRRKTASARVRLNPEGTGQFTINGKSLEDYFGADTLIRSAKLPIHTAELVDKVDVDAKVIGGGPMGQAVAIAHGVARAIEKFDGELRAPLKKAGHLKRDPRRRERKKAGQPGARKRFQFSKR